MPLCTIFTKWPAPSGPTCAQQGVPSTCAAIDSRTAEGGVGVVGAADHDRGPVQGALLAAGDTHADEVQALLGQRLLTAAGVPVVRVAGVHHDVALVEQRHQLVDDRVGPGARLDHHDDRARPPDGGDEALDALAADEVTLVAELLEQAGHPRRGPVVHRDRVPVPGDVAGQVAAQHREPGEPDGRPGGGGRGFGRHAVQPSTGASR
jgi:hypothetical protein